jgi:hypothetical protein
MLRLLLTIALTLLALYPALVWAVENSELERPAPAAVHRGE